jgi:hypothetical protein
MKIKKGLMIREKGQVNYSKLKGPVPQQALGKENGC